MVLKLFNMILKLFISIMTSELITGASKWVSHPDSRTLTIISDDEFKFIWHIRRMRIFFPSIRLGI